MPERSVAKSTSVENSTFDGLALTRLSTIDYSQSVEYDEPAAARLLERGRILGFAFVDWFVFTEAMHCYYVGYDEDGFC